MELGALFNVMCQPGWEGCLGENGGGVALVAKSFSTLATPWTGACQAPLPMQYARILEWVVISFSRESSRPRNWTWVSGFAGKFFTNWAMREALYIYMAKFICFLPETVTTLLIVYTPIQNVFGVKKKKLKSKTKKQTKDSARPKVRFQTTSLHKETLNTVKTKTILQRISLS